MYSTHDSLKLFFYIKYEEYKKQKLRKDFIERKKEFLKKNKFKEDLMTNTITAQSFINKPLSKSQSSLIVYLYTVMIVAMCTIISFVLAPYLKETNSIMIYLLGVIFVAILGQVGPSILASLLSFLTYDYFFNPPYFSFSVWDIQYFFTLIVLMLVAQIISHLTIRVGRNIEVARKAEVETENERFRNLLLTSVSHDLRTPLTAIMGSASSLLLSGKIMNEDMQRELAQNIYDESERLNNLVNNILRIIKLESGGMQLSKQSYALEEIIGSALSKLEKQLENKPVAIQLPKYAPLIPLDNILIGQVFNNLIENAIKFTPSDSPINISLEFNTQHALIKISDRGMGINSKDANKIFDKFYRGQKSEVSGVGLGLAICKGIILAHRGRIWVESQPEGGAVFCFTLPMKG